MNLVDEVVAASAKPQRAFEWTIEIATLTARYDNLREPGDDFATLDAKLASALTHFVPPDFQRTLHAKKMEAMKCGQMIAGRHPLSHRSALQDVGDGRGSL